jgi:hypothetical protein
MALSAGVSAAAPLQPVMFIVFDVKVGKSLKT